MIELVSGTRKKKDRIKKLLAQVLLFFSF